jgi:flavin reductase (DIM6/NTAB) family NADH-FMN oxidoreductase RutF
MPDFAAINDVSLKTDREVWLLTTRADEARAGLIATFVSQASIVAELPRVVAGIAKQHHTWTVLQRSGHFVLHLLTEDHLDLVWRFGLQSGHAVDKWAGVSCVDGPAGPRLPQALAWLDCRVEAALDIGDRTFYVAEVLEGRSEHTGVPLTMRRLIQLAPAERLRALKDGLLRDAVVDAAAVLAWRQRRMANEPRTE